MIGPGDPSSLSKAPPVIPGMVWRSMMAHPLSEPRVIDLVPNNDERLFTVGRLDLSSEGLMLVTNDGQAFAECRRIALQPRITMA